MSHSEPGGQTLLYSSWSKRSANGQSLDQDVAVLADHRIGDETSNPSSSRRKLTTEGGGGARYSSSMDSNDENVETVATDGAQGMLSSREVMLPS